MRILSNVLFLSLLRPYKIKNKRIFPKRPLKKSIQQ